MTKIYCVYCGEKNDSNDKKCNKCKKKLNPKSHPFINYVVEKCKGDINDSLYKNIIKFLKAKMYGIILSASVIGTVTIVITNVISNDYITELKEEPVFSYSKKQYTYLGEGLNKNEVIDKYLGYILNSDIESANGLIAENFLTKDFLDSIPFDQINKRYYSKIKHELLTDNTKFTKYLSKDNGITIDKDAYVGRFSELHFLNPSVVHNDNFDINAHYIELSYCFDEDCTNNIKLMEVIETIETEGNVYILSEYAFLTDNYSRVVRYMFDSNNGDLTNVDNNYYYNTLDTCLDEYGTVICDLPLPEFGEV